AFNWFHPEIDIGIGEPEADGTEQTLRRSSESLAARRCLHETFSSVPLCGLGSFWRRLRLFRQRLSRLFRLLRLRVPPTRLASPIRLQLGAVLLRLSAVLGN